MLPTDFEPYGRRSRQIGGPDCSCGCAWYHTLIGAARRDWGICANPSSPRCGLLTFEHQGCEQFEEESREDDAASESSDETDTEDLELSTGRPRRTLGGNYLNLTIDSELPNGIAPVLMSYFNINPIRDKVLAEAANQQDRPNDIAKDPFVTSSSRFTPFIAAYDLCIIDVSDVLTLPVHRLAKLIENAWIDLQLQRKRGYHVRIKEDDSHTISFPDSLTLVHPQTGVKYYAESLGSMLLVKGLEHLKEELERRNLRAYSLPYNLSGDDWRAFIADRAIVTDEPEEYLWDLSELSYRLIDISRISDLPASALADRIYFAWVDLGLRSQAACHVVLKKLGTSTLTYPYGVDRIDE
jgi:hypothetical protein